MLTLVIALVSCIGVVVASILNHRAVTTAAKIAAGDTIRFDAALIAALAQLRRRSCSTTAPSRWPSSRPPRRSRPPA